MSDSKKSPGCIGFLILALFLGTFAYIVHRVTSMDAWDGSEIPHHPNGPRKHLEWF